MFVDNIDEPVNEQAIIQDNLMINKDNISDEEVNEKLNNNNQIKASDGEDPSLNNIKSRKKRNKTKNKNMQPTEDEDSNLLELIDSLKDTFKTCHFPECKIKLK